MIGVIRRAANLSFLTAFIDKEPVGMSPTTTVTVTRCAVPTASSLALDDGRLADALAPLGLAAAELGAGPGRGPAHFDHGAEWLLREGGNVPALWARSRGAATRLVGL